MDKAEAFEIVSTQGWLSQQPEDFRARLLNRAAVKSFDAHHDLFKAGDFNNGIYGLVEGALEISWDHPQLSGHLLHIGRPGIWVGEGVAYGFPTRLVSARTRTKTTVVYLSRQKTEDLIAEDPKCLAFFGRLTVLHLEVSFKIIGELLYRDPLIRVSARLVTMCDAHTMGKPTGITKLNVTQDDLAALSNLSRKTLNRTLSTLKEAGVVEPHYGYVTILDFEKLRDIASARVHLDSDNIEQAGMSLPDSNTG